MRWWVAFVVVLLLGGVRAAAQTTPHNQPLIPGTIAVAAGAPIGSAFTHLGKFSVPYSDGTCNNDGNHGGCFYWGGSGMTVVPGANQLNFGCFDWRDQVARISIPAIGGTAGIVQRCVSISNLSSIDPGDATNGYTIGGIYQAAAGGPAVVSAWSYYDGDGSTTKSHWLTSNTFSNQQGPFQVGTLGAGRVGGQMTPIPPEWQALFGGDMLTGLCCTSIIGRSSFGPSASVTSFALFARDANGDGRIDEPVPATPVLYYDQAHAMGNPGSGQSDLYNNGTFIRGMFWVPGTRTVAFVGIQPIGVLCYGPSEGPNATCPHDPVNPTTQNSYHGYPYVHQVWLYDALDLLAVKQGKKHMGDVRPYALARLAGVPVTASLMRSATYDPATKRMYLVAAYGDTPEVHVFSVAGGTTPPPPTEVCGDGIDNDKDGQVDEGCPVNCVVSEFSLSSFGAWEPAVCPTSGEQTRSEVWTRTVITPASNGGTACPALQEPRVGRQMCTPPPIETLDVIGIVVRIDQITNQGVTTYVIRIKNQFGEVNLGPWGGLQAPGMSRPIQVGDRLDWKWTKP